nr:DUF952 domain-containing protein [Pseudovibrio hongkongensis]
MALIYKIAPRTMWEAAIKTGVFSGAPVDIADGYIHFSTDDTLQGTLDKHFAGQQDLLLLAFRSEDFAPDELKWEPSRGGALFPHLYAPLPTAKLYWQKPIPMNDDGSHSLPELSQ